MIVILNGSVGVGKTTTAWALSRSFEKSVMLDGDHLGAVYPFEIYDDARVAYLYKTLEHLISFHQKHGYPNFVINYVFESPELLSALTQMLEPLGNRVYTFWLTCAPEAQRARILKRNTDQVTWELERLGELNTILEAASERGNIGTQVDTTGKTVAEMVTLIRSALSKTG